MPPDAWDDEVVSRLVDGTAGDDEHAALPDLLKDPEALDRFITCLSLHVTLRELMAVPNLQAAPTAVVDSEGRLPVSSGRARADMSRRPHPRRRAWPSANRRAFWAVGAAAVLMIAAWHFLVPGSGSQTPAPTATEIARLESIAGEVTVLDAADRRSASGGQGLLSGQGLETSDNSSAVVRYADGTKLEIAGRTTVRQFIASPDKQVLITSGQLSADVSKQPDHQPMIFVTPQGNAVVLGTKLRLLVEADPKLGTRLEVDEGKVRLTRASDQKSVDVPAGCYAVAAQNQELMSRALRIDEIILLPGQGQLVGSEWRLIKDDQTSAGESLEAQEASLSSIDGFTTNSHVLFTFEADADKPYTLWIRGRTTADPPRWEHDMVAIETPGGVMNKPDIIEQNLLGVGDDRAYVGGWGFEERGYYSWSAGEVNGREAAPITVRFKKSGTQVLKMFSFEAPIRIDAIWLSATEKSRPPDQQTVPVLKK